MSDQIYTTTERLIEIECLIEYFRWARSAEESQSNRTYRILVQMAKELRRSQDAKPSLALADLAKKITAADASKTRLGHSIGALQEIAWATIEHWPAIKSALEAQTVRDI